MNKKNNAKSKIIILAAAALCAVLIGCGVAAFADTDLLTPSGTQVTAGSGLSFKVNVGELNEEYSQAEKQYTLTVNIGPSPESVSVSPGVNLNQYGSKYTISSADLESVSALTFTVYPGKSITSETAYTVTACASGELGTVEDSFTFTAVPAKEKKSDKKKDEKEKGGMKKGGSAAASGGVSAAASSDSSTVYKGSGDNYLKKLSVEGYDFTEKFNSTRDTYFVEVPESVEDITVNATAHDSSAVVRVAGNEELSEDGKIMVSVTADNGDVRTYRIFVTHSRED